MANPLNSAPDDLRYCICADPENCREAVPGYVCRRRASLPSAPLNVAQAREMIAAMLRRHRLGYTERFEEDAERFYRETGMLAPGKSVPLAMAGAWDDDDRSTAWNAFCETLRNEALQTLESALAVARLLLDWR